MRGKNTLLLNQAEMQAAVEYYLNQVQFKQPVKVTRITEQVATPNLFEIILEEEKPISSVPEGSIHASR